MPSSELNLAEDLYRQTALDDLRGIPEAKMNDDRFYRTLDRVIVHKDAIEQHLRNRLGEMFGIKYDLLLYDVTSTYFEGLALANPQAQRGHSRDHRPDCKQVCIALVVTREGIPLAHEVFDGNRVDVTTSGHRRMGYLCCGNRRALSSSGWSCCAMPGGEALWSLLSVPVFLFISRVVCVASAMPLANAMLLAHPIGRHAIARRTAVASLVIGAGFVSAIVVCAMAWIDGSCVENHGWAFWATLVLPFVGLFGMRRAMKE